MMADKDCSPLTTSWDWSSYRYSCGAFKLDHPGDHVHSDRLFKYHKFTWTFDQSVNSRVLLASDSYSHLGGWLEGAFQSSLNALVGVLCRLGCQEQLNPEAQAMMRRLNRPTAAA